MQQDLSQEEKEFLRNKLQASKSGLSEEEKQMLRGQLSKSQKSSMSNLLEDMMSTTQKLQKHPMTVPANLAYGTGQLVRHGGNTALQLMQMLGVNPENLGLPKQISKQ